MRESQKNDTELEDEEPYFKGRADFARGLLRPQNPYENDPDTYATTYWESWFDGWDDAHNEQQESGKSLR